MDLDAIRELRGFAPLIEFHLSTLFPDCDTKVCVVGDGHRLMALLMPR